MQKSRVESPVLQLVSASKASQWAKRTEKCLYLFVFLFLIFSVVQDWENHLISLWDIYLGQHSSNEIEWALTFNCLDFIFPRDTSSFEVLKISEKFCPFLKRKPSSTIKPNCLFVKMLIPHTRPKISHDNEPGKISLASHGAFCKRGRC